MPDRGGIRAHVERHLRAATTPCRRLQFLRTSSPPRRSKTVPATRLLLRRRASPSIVLGGDGTHRAVVRELVGRQARRADRRAVHRHQQRLPGDARAHHHRAGRRPAATAGRMRRRGPGAQQADRGRIIGAASAARHRHRRRRHHARPQRRRARALWKPVAGRGLPGLRRPEAIGLSAIGGLLQPVGRREGGGLAVQLAADARHALLDLHAPIAPGHGAAGAGGGAGAAWWPTSRWPSPPRRHRGAGRRARAGASTTASA